FLREILELRSQSSLQPLPCPNQLAAEGGQIRSATLLPFNQRRPEKQRPLLNQIPCVPIGHPGPFGGPANFSCHSNFVQEIEHHQDGKAIALSLKTPDRFNLDMNHVVARQFIYRSANRMQISYSSIAYMRYMLGGW